MLALTLLVTTYDFAGHAHPAWLLASAAFLLGTFALAGALLTLLWRAFRGLPALFI